MKKTNKKIIAVVGMAGSGKSTVIKYLEKKYGWPKVYFGEPTFERMKKDGMKLNYKNERIVREKIRVELGMGAYAKLSLPKIKKLLKDNDVVLVESLYSWQEYVILKKKYPKNFQLIAVVANTETRFSRLKKRKKERPMKTRKEFDERDWTEIENLRKGGPIAIADYTIINNDGLKTLHVNINKAIKNKFL